MCVCVCVCGVHVYVLGRVQTNSSTHLKGCDYVSLLVSLAHLTAANIPKPPMVGEAHQDGVVSLHTYCNV